MLQANFGVVSEIEPVTLPSGTTVLKAVGTELRDKGAFIHQIRVVNADSQARTITIDKYNGTTAFPLVYDMSIAAGEVYTDEFEFSLTAGWSLRATPEVADKLTIHVTLSTRP